MPRPSVSLQLIPEQRLSYYTVLYDLIHKHNNSLHIRSLEDLAPYFYGMQLGHVWLNYRNGSPYVYVRPNAIEVVEFGYAQHAAPTDSDMPFPGPQMTCDGVPVDWSEGTPTHFKSALYGRITPAMTIIPSLTIDGAFSAQRRDPTSDVVYRNHPHSLDWSRKT